MLAFVAGWVGLVTGCDKGSSTPGSTGDGAPSRLSAAAQPTPPNPGQSEATAAPHTYQAVDPTQADKTEIPPPSEMATLPSTSVARETALRETPSPGRSEMTEPLQTSREANPGPSEPEQTTLVPPTSAAELLPEQDSASALMERLVDRGWRAVPSDDGSIVLLPPNATKPAE
jgi:hypothetical protein